ncbi:uncharacterized protein LOC134239382 [Saccostrea cucullata]|uniref:uncharacterized protein LOC134239382 n=1 Tax=Saccostrea cuccullata TaxID=36930 RepID=UPI002ED5FC4C
MYYRDLRQNKGSILKASVEYMKELINDKDTMQKLEENQQAMNSKFQKLLVRIFQLELKMKLYGLSEDFGNFRVKKKKKPRKRLSDINAMVDDFIMQSTPKSFSKKKKKTGFSRIRNKGDAPQNDNEYKVADAKEGLREHLNKKLSTEEHARQGTMFDVASSKDKGHRKQNEVNIPPSQSLAYVCDAQTEKANAQNDNVTSQTIALNEGEEIMELSTEQFHVLLNLFENHQNGSEQNLNTADCSSNAEDVSANVECLSPVTSTCNMLESLLRRPKILSGNVSESSGLEDSTESQKGLR